jgi:hypothetical protein
MKLSMIAEARTLVEMDHNMWRAQADQVAVEQSAKNLVVTALQKIRNMLGPMGLTKNPIQKHRVTEPIGPAVGPFSSLRRVVQARANRDAQMLLSGQGNREAIGQFWGIQLPTGWYDVHAGQRGKVNAEGQFDDLIRQTVAAAEGQPVEAKIELLNQLAAQI